MKALGASNGLVGAFFLGEQILLALVGGGLGYAGRNFTGAMAFSKRFRRHGARANHFASCDARNCDSCRAGR